MVKTDKQKPNGFGIYKTNILAQVIKFINIQQSNELNVGTKTLHTIYIVNVDWYKKWKKYVSYDEFKSNSKRATTFGNQLYNPNTIHNYTLVDEDKHLAKSNDEIDPSNIKLKSNIKEGTHYIALHENEWKFLKDIYGCDIEISRFQYVHEGVPDIEAILPAIPYIIIPTHESKLSNIPFKIKYTQMSKYQRASELKTRIVNIESTPIYGTAISVEGIKLWSAIQKGYANLSELNSDFKKSAKKFISIENNSTIGSLCLDSSAYILVESAELDPLKCNVCNYCQSKYLKVCHS